MRNNVTASALVGAVIFMLLSCSRDIDDPPIGYPPLKPEGLIAYAKSHNEITLSWQDAYAGEEGADAAESYIIFQSKNSSGGYSIVSSVGDCQKTVTNLLPSTKYYFKLMAGNRYGASDTSDIVSQKTLLDVPKNLKATFLPLNSLMLEWDEVIDNETVLRGTGGNTGNGASDVKYKIYLSDDSEHGYSQEFTFVGETNETKMNLPLGDNEKTYYLKVSAVDSDGRESAKSDYVSASVLGSLPSVPQGLNAVLTVDNKDNGKIGAKLTWNKVNDANEYKVYYSTQPQVSYDYYAPSKNNSTTVIGLKAGTLYYFKVSAVNSNGESAKSQEVSVQTTAPTAPSTPTGLQAEVIASDEILITWNSVSTATGYYFYYARSQNGTYTRAGSPFSDDGLILGPSWAGTWYVKISAVNDYGESPLSSPIQVTIGK